MDALSKDITGLRQEDINDAGRLIKNGMFEDNNISIIPIPLERKTDM